MGRKRKQSDGTTHSPIDQEEAKRRRRFRDRQRTKIRRELFGYLVGKIGDGKKRLTQNHTLMMSVVYIEGLEECLQKVSWNF